MTIGGHHSPVAKTDTWLTPPAIVQALGTFDLDPCCPPVMPWPTAGRHFTAMDDGLRQPWAGRVWLNPPYGPPQVVTPWMRKLAAHGRGTALIFARTETAMFFETVWRAASAVFFMQGRLYFHDASGRRADANAGAPSVLVAYGAEDARLLRDSGLAGHFVPLARDVAA